MKRAPILLSAAAGLLSLLMSACGGNVYPQGEIALSDRAHAAQMERGKMLVTTTCGACHLDPETKALTGKQMKDIPKMLGTISTDDITRDVLKTYPYTPESLAYLLRTGIKHDGTVSPFMAFPHLSDEDMAAMIAFLWSEDPMTKSVPHEPHPMKLSAIGKAAFNGFKPLPKPQGPVPHPDTKDEIAYGRYLVHNLNCFDCHSASMMKINKMEPEKSKGYMGGGGKMLSADGKKIVVPNLTPDATGIAGWTVKDFDRAIRQGMNPHNKPLRYPMPNYAALGDAEVKAIFAYLKSIPPIKNQTRKEVAMDGGGEGKVLYAQYGCQGCHGEKGKGVADLTKAYAKYSDAQIKALIRNPRSVNASSTMPQFDGVIKEADYAPLIEYVKQLGHNAATAKKS